MALTYTHALMTSFVLWLLFLYFAPKTTESDINVPVTCSFPDSSIQVEPFNSPERLNILDDENYVNPLNLTCKPESFGYSEEEASKLFPTINFPTCESIYESKSGMLNINLDDNTLTMNCKGSYILGVKDDDEEFGYSEFSNTLKTYKTPVKLESEEYAFGTCEDDKDAFFEHVAYVNRPKKSALNRAKSTLIGEAINIAMVVLDSVSRRSFYRKLPRSVEFLNNLPKNYSISDFKIHNVMGEYSADSFMPTFFGDMKYSRFKEAPNNDPFYDSSL